MKKVACIWARTTPAFIWKKMFEIWKLLVSNDFDIATWNAEGADFYFARGWNEINEKKIHLYLPLKDYNKNQIKPLNEIYKIYEPYYFQIPPNVEQILKEVHYFWEKTNDKIKKIHYRNYKIIENSLCVICYTPNWKDVWWTGVWIRIAKKLNIPIFNLYRETDEKKFYIFFNNLIKKQWWIEKNNIN